MSQYKLLLDGSERLPASIALANSYRWSGRPDLAEPLYDRSLLDDFTNKDALEGLEYTDRELKPRTLMTAGGQNDSGGQRFRYQIASHRWRDRTRQHIFEIEAAAHQQKYLPEGLSLRQAHLGFRYEGVALPLNPQLWIKGQMTPFTGVYGGASVRVLEPNTRVSLERMLDRMGEITVDETFHGPAGARSYNYEPTYILRGLTDIHVRFTPAA